MMHRFLRSGGGGSSGREGLKGAIKQLEAELLCSRYKYVVRPLRYDGTEAELAAELARLYNEIAKHTNPLWEIKKQPQEKQLR